MRVQTLGQEDPLEKGMSTHSSSLAWITEGQRNLLGYSPQNHKESDTTEATSHAHRHVPQLYKVDIYYHYQSTDDNTKAQKDECTVGDTDNKQWT